MKIIHTSDWHLGNTLHNYPRFDDHLLFFNHLAEIMANEKPDALIVAGDIFDSAIPSIASQRFLVAALKKIHEVSPITRIVITAGNHDSASRLDIHRVLWQKINVNIFSMPSVKSDSEPNSDSLILELPEKGFILAIPFISEGNYSRFAGKTAEKLSAMETFHQKLLNRIKERNTNNLPVVMTAHVAVSPDVKELQNRTQLIFHSLKEMGSGYDYLALGHIHCPITMTGSNNSIARYCGSPFAMSFDENHLHSISVVKLFEHGKNKPEIREIIYEGATPLITFPPKESFSPEITLDMLSKIPEGNGEFIRVNIKVDSLLPANVRHKIEQILTEKNYRFCLVNPIRTEPNKSAQLSEISLLDLPKANPIEIADVYFKMKHGQSLPMKYEIAIKEIINELARKDREE